jgi:predicted transcriptional regulator
MLEQILIQGGLIVAALAPTIPLYTRLTRKTIENNASHSEILQIIKEKPGIHYNAVLRKTDRKNGSVRYSIQKLKEFNFITEKEDGIYTRYFLKNSHVNGPPSTKPSGKKTREIFNIIKNNKNIKKQEIAEKLNITLPSAEHHITKLEEKGYVTKVKHGIYAYYSAN